MQLTWKSLRRNGIAGQLLRAEPLHIRGTYFITRPVCAATRRAPRVTPWSSRCWGGNYFNFGILLQFASCFVRMSISLHNELQTILCFCSHELLVLHQMYLRDFFHYCSDHCTVSNSILLPLKSPTILPIQAVF